ncbi:glucose-6-phosphate isomerase, partial [Candidatus Saccharibacteria bacterium]|nr:glucose-6-phosphate isomerase [Candidatus Saccharibacteria bacterium]
LTAVGLLPLAVAGVDIDNLLESASDAVVSVVEPAVKYAWMRYTFGKKGYDTEVFASFEPSTLYFNEWLKQLFGESEGKGRQGVFPASVIYSTDLHSLGQFMQDGRRNLWETIIDFPTDDLNSKVVQAVRVAHTQGGIPVLEIGVESFDEKGFGELIYFFELACAISAKLFGVNPFDQPGVEAYKNELKKLMGETTK